MLQQCGYIVYFWSLTWETLVKLGDPWWGTHHFFFHRWDYLAEARWSLVGGIHHFFTVGITSLKLGDPWWGALTKKKLNGFAIFIYRWSRSKCICMRAAPVNKKSCAMHSFSFFFVIRLGFEPKTHSLEGCCSIQLSYRTGLSIPFGECKDNNYFEIT